MDPSHSLDTVEVAVALPVSGTYTYRVPEPLRSAAAAGKRVLVPFGRRRATGYILGPGSDWSGGDIKPVFAVLDDSPVFPDAMIPLFRWTADYYAHPIGGVIQTALPGGLTVLEASHFDLTEQGRRYLEAGEASEAEKRALDMLAQGPLRPRELRLRQKPDAAPALLASLERRGFIRRGASLKGGTARPLRESWVRFRSPAGEEERLSEKKRTLLDVIAAAGELPVRELAARIPRASAHLKPLEQARHVERFSRRLYRDPLGEPITADVAPVLTGEQSRAVAVVAAALGKGFHTFLLRGVTGSGKTEVYLRAAEAVVGAGKSVLVLVPEIAIITQTEHRFRARFGERVAVLHSGLSEGERYDQWCRILQRQARIAVGARSAVFAPFTDLGLIVVDEEHDDSYKQEGGLHYNARDLAVVRARQDGCVALLGSATPSLQSYHNALSGKYSELTLENRVEERPLPEIRVVDLRQTRDLRGPARFIGTELRTAMAETLGRGEQVLLFLNRRGFANFPVCAACGAAVRCRRCDISLTLHQSANAYRCHYCGFSLPATTACPACGATRIKHLGMGTEKVEAAVRSLFPEARVARMDRDTTRRRGALLALLKGLREKRIDVLVGTQMVAKGHDFPDITLVGIICADLSLNFPDFRAGERTFQLLAQVAGRAGRGGQPGRVVLQTYNPEHFSIRAARDQDVVAFYRQEIAFRQQLRYPPFSKLVQMRILGRDPGRTRELAEALGEGCRRLATEDAGCRTALEAMGPIEAALPRIAGNYRWQMLLKSPHSAVLRRFVGRLLGAYPHLFSDRRARVVIDVDPVFML